MLPLFAVVSIKFYSLQACQILLTKEIFRANKMR